MSFMQFEPFEGLLLREQRKHRLLRGVIRSAELGKQDVLIRNLSPRGLGGKTLNTPLVIGAETEVIIQGEVVVSATVRWAKGNAFGLQFDREIDPEVIAAWLNHESVQPTGEAWEVRTRHRIYRSTPLGPLRRI